MSGSVGRERLVVIYSNHEFGKTISLQVVLPTKIKSVDDLPDPFEAKSQWCGCTATYPKDAIKIATDIGP
jgi:hypothetical protein